MTKTKDESPSEEKASVTLPGTVEKIIPAVGHHEPEKAQIAVEGADDLYREIRIDNTLQDEAGDDVSLKKGAELRLQSPQTRMQRQRNSLSRKNPIRNKLVAHRLFGKSHVRHLGQS
jgi:hypothetical protein